MTEYKVNNVPVKEAWFSKVNWVQLAGPVATLLVWLGVPGITPEMLVAVFAAIQTLQSFVTIILRTWFTTELTMASALRMTNEAPPKKKK